MNELSPLDDSSFHETPDDFPSRLLAELYVGGDLSPEAAEAFEAALDEPELLEQLVVSVQVRDAVRSDAKGFNQPARFSVPSTQFQPSRWQVVGYAFAAAAACVVLMTAGFFAGPDGTSEAQSLAENNTREPAAIAGQLDRLPADAEQSQGAVRQGSALSEESFAPVWLDLVDGAGAERFGSGEIGITGEAARAVIEREPSSSDEIEGNATNVPDWLYAAVGLPGDEFEEEGLEFGAPLGDTL